MATLGGTLDETRGTGAAEGAPGGARAAGAGVRGAAAGLTLVGTPIGNLGDLSPRAVEALRAADVVCAEDTRVSGRLLAAFDLRARLERCDENVIAARAPQLVERMRAGERVAFVSDAGMPAVADPGARLVDACLDAGVPVDVVPGPSAVTCAVAHAGFSCTAFYFGGFLPRKEGERDRLLATLALLPAVLVFYESPHRAAASLASVARAFPDRRAALARELTKLHQEVLRAPAPELAELVDKRGDALKGECVIVVDAPDPAACERAQNALGFAASLSAPASVSAASSSSVDAPGPQPAPAAVSATGGFDLDGAIRAGLAAGKGKSALAKELAKCCELARGEVYGRICEIAKG